MPGPTTRNSKKSFPTNENSQSILVKRKFEEQHTEDELESRSKFNSIDLSANGAQDISDEISMELHETHAEDKLESGSEFNSTVHSANGAQDSSDETSVELHETHSEDESPKYRVAIIGGGWSGTEVARALKERGHSPVIFEAGKDGPVGTSTKYSCHTHPTGSHYNRMPERFVPLFIKNYRNFLEKRPDYVKENPNSITGIVETDAKGQPSRTSPETFKKRSEKFDPNAKIVKPGQFKMSPLPLAIVTSEERIINGDDFKQRIRLSYMDAGINFYYGTPITSVTRVDNGYRLTFVCDGKEEEAVFDKVVNATGFQQFIPENFRSNPFGLDVVYQPVVALVYKDMKAQEEPMISVLLIDGSCPCLMPTANDGEYFLTHCGFTLLASKETPSEAWDILGKVNDSFIRTEVQPKAEEDLMRYIPGFRERFKPIGYNGGVIAKLRTENEFRLAFAFAAPDPLGIDTNESNGIIYVFPGKITSIVTAAKEEVVPLVEGCQLIKKDGYEYPIGGMLDDAYDEVSRPPQEGFHNACTNNHFESTLDVASDEVSRQKGYETNRYPNSISRYGLYGNHVQNSPISSRRTRSHSIGSSCSTDSREPNQIVEVEYSSRRP